MKKNQKFSYVDEPLERYDTLRKDSKKFAIVIAVFIGVLCAFLFWRN